MAPREAVLLNSNNDTDNVIRNLSIQNEGRFMCRTMIVGMILGRVAAHSFLRNIDANTPHETCMDSSSDYDSGFPMLNMTERQPQKHLV